MVLQLIFIVNALPAFQVTPHALVAFEPGVDVQAAAASLGVTLEAEVLPTRRLWKVRDATGARDGAQLAAALHGAKGVRYVEADLAYPRTRHAMPVPPDDPRYPGQWYLKKIGIEAAWTLSTGSPDVTVLVIDNGCDMEHPDLKPHLLPGLDVVDQDDDPSVAESGAGSNHGTACAGIVAAVGNNARDIAGTCPECRVRCVRFLDKEKPVPISADVQAMRFALEHHDVAVVSNSWGFTGHIQVPQSLREAIEDVSRLGHGGKGALVIFAAGNDNRELTPGELYSIPEVLTVGAINNFDEAAPFSNRGAEVDLTAPTGSLTLDVSGPGGEDPGDTTSLFGGTSAACPVAAGAAALLFSYKPDATANEVREALIAGTRRAPYASPDADGHDPLYGYGILDPAASMALLVPPVELPLVTDTLGPADGCGCGTANSVLPALLLAAFSARKRRYGTRRRSDDDPAD